MRQNQPSEASSFRQSLSCAHLKLPNKLSDVVRGDAGAQVTIVCVVLKGQQRGKVALLHS